MTEIMESEPILFERAGKIPIEVMYLPRPASNYPGGYPLGFEKHLERLLGTKNYVHFFSGNTKTGFRIDNKGTNGPDLVADVQDLHGLIPDNEFDGGMADPIYNEDFAKNLYHCPYPKWSLWTHELVRVVKPGGLIGIMQNYPVPQLINCEWVKLVVIIQRIKQFPKIVTIQRKLE